MSATQPSKLAIVCPEQCSLHPEKIGEDKANLLRRLRETGAGQTIFMREGAVILGQPIAGGTAQRHLKHYKPVDGTPAAELPVADPEKASNLQILERIIQRGFANSHNWKPTIKDTLDAMRLHVQITGNTGDDELLKLFDQALEPEAENPEAVAAPEEREEALPPPAL